MSSRELEPPEVAEDSPDSPATGRSGPSSLLADTEVDANTFVDEAAMSADGTFGEASALVEDSGEDNQGKEPVEDSSFSDLMHNKYFIPLLAGMCCIFVLVIVAVSVPLALANSKSSSDSSQPDMVTDNASALPGVSIPSPSTSNTTTTNPTTNTTAVTDTSTSYPLTVATITMPPSTDVPISINITDPTTTTTTTSEKVVIGFQIDLIGVAHQIAMDKGYYSSLNLDVEMIPSPPGSLLKTRQATDDSNLVEWDFGSADILENILSGPQGLLGVGIGLDVSAQVQLVGNKEGVELWPPTSMDGIPVVVTPNSVGEYVAQVCLELIGLSKDDVEFLYEDQAGCIDALTPGAEGTPARANLGGLWAPNTFTFFDSVNGSAPLCSGASSSTPTITKGFMVPQSFAQEKPLAVAKVLAGYLRAANFIKDETNKEEVIDYMAALYRTQDKEISRSSLELDLGHVKVWSLETQLVHMERRGSPTLSSYDIWTEEFKGYMMSKEIIQDLSNPAAYIDDRFMRAVDMEPVLKLWATEKPDFVANTPFSTISPTQVSEQAPTEVPTKAPIDPALICANEEPFVPGEQIVCPEIQINHAIDMDAMPSIGLRQIPDLDVLSFTIAGITWDIELAQEECPDQWGPLIACVIGQCPHFLEVCPDTLLSSEIENDDVLAVQTAVCCGSIEQSIQDQIGRSNEECCLGECSNEIQAITICMHSLQQLPLSMSVAPATAPPSTAPSYVPSMVTSLVPTSATVSVLLAHLSDLAVTAEGVFDDRDSAQYEAALWLADKDEYVATNGLDLDDPRLLQRYALASLYYSTGGDNWKLCGRASPSCGDTAWLTSGDECDWFAVDCESADLVSQISFPSTGNDLIGVLPPELSLLTGLKRFLAPENSLQGNLDVALGGISSIETLALPDNRLTGSIPTGVLVANPNLRLLAIGGNQFSGPIPSDLFALSALTDLQLHGNSLTGTIPAEIGALSMLENIEMQANMLVGEIPDELFSLTMLVTVQVHENAGINGTINPLISKLTSMNTLRLGFTGIGGVIPDEIFLLTSLSEVSLEGAQFTGTIPEQIKNLNASLMDLFLNDNRFTGSIPDAFDFLTALETLQIQGNQLVGSISAGVCAERGLRFQQLATLIADCNIECTCCDTCEP